MKIGVPKEIKNSENRVGLVPSGVQALVSDGHHLYVERSAGQGIGISDQQYEAAGATILPSIEAVYEEAEMIIKVKEPLPLEVGLLNSKHLLFTYLHLAADKNLTSSLMQKGVTAVAYETIQEDDKSLPLLFPMSEVAGRMSPQVGADALHINRGGKGVLLSGVPGVRRGNVVVIGCGVAGMNAIKVATGLGAHVTALDINLQKLNYLDDLYANRVSTLYSNEENIEKSLSSADIVIGAVLITGHKAPKLVRKEHLKLMEMGSVLVDIAVDQGGCFETTHPTTHDNPTYVEDGIIHYCVANMPGAVAQTSTYSLTNSTLPYARKLARFGVTSHLFGEDPRLKSGVNIMHGDLVYRPVAYDLDLPYTEFKFA